MLDLSRSNAIDAAFQTQPYLEDLTAKLGKMAAVAMERWRTRKMDVSMPNIETMTETELRELLQGAEQALRRLVAKRARSTLKEARRMAAEVGFEAVFTKVGKTDGAKAKEKPQSSGAKVLPKYHNPDNADEVWSGRGRQPKWVQAALAEGQSLSDLAIHAEETAMSE